MKKILLFAAIFTTTLSFSQVGVFVEKTASEIGKSGDFKLTLISSKNLKTSAVEKRVLLDSKSSSLELNKAGLTELISTMKELKSEYMSKILTSNIEISNTGHTGVEIGASFVLDKPTTTAPVTKKEKYFIDTPEKYYEGKIVNRDATGTYIWKEVTTTAATKEQTGKWMPYVRLSNNSKTNLSVDEFDSLLKFLEENAAKL